ncbi:putative short-chain dehydrogenase [Aspergillus heteromorphus CBS 117.55]|uniref:Putative short-chain dehydrogenase n=1 Tax=Aspergillus heteromorphus CBS 117.55 TaxID=1448321 RepID=A0A317WD66_9EURO|nr:putative short-chain dehydrogenase [Aspergillus heteromorphus CBS 117.55]PWY82110.1 putative short-chain dehydrogenase [Aspergillus heteromorphus CBS 117.55]
MPQSSIIPTPAGTSLKGKTCLITGANTGIGLEIARQLLALNASRVIITSRDVSKGQAAVAALRKDSEVTSKNPTAIVETFHLDLDDYRSVMKFCEQVKGEVRELDILICNGGTNIMDFQRSKTGHERVMQVNCYSHFLLILELLPLLKSTSLKRGTPSRLTIVGSGTQHYHTLSKTPLRANENVLSHWDDTNIYQGLSRYSDSKLTINAFIRRLANTVPDTEVIINNFCPGMVAGTALDAGIPIWLRAIMRVLRRFRGRTLEQAGWMAMHVVAVAGRETHGKFFQNNRVDAGPPFLQSPAGVEYIDRLWSDFLGDVIPLDTGLEVFKE